MASLAATVSSKRIRYLRTNSAETILAQGTSLRYFRISRSMSSAIFPLWTWRDGTGASAVSYTHLDVYKRQGIYNIKTLKNREYAARGFGFVYSETDDDFDRMPYTLSLIHI